MEGHGDGEASHCSRCDRMYMLALYQINIEAKRYAEAAENAYEAGFKQMLVITVCARKRYTA